MHYRCENSSNRKYPDYGGRGITVCADWREFLPFYEWAIKRWQPGLQLDRRNNDGNYEPSNCRFVTPTENNRNRRNSVQLTAFGETKTLVQWVADPRCVPGLDTLKSRLYGGWSPEQSLSTPVRVRILRGVS